MRLTIYFILLAIVCGCVSAPRTEYSIRWPRNPFFNRNAHYFAPAKEGRYPTIIMLHGSEGGAIHNRDSEATILAQLGYNVLTYCYFSCGSEGGYLAGVEVRDLIRAVQTMRALPENNGKIILYGFSRGAELALIAASLATGKLDRIDAVIAHSPSDIFNKPYISDWTSKRCFVCKSGPGTCSLYYDTRNQRVWDKNCGFDPLKDETASAWQIDGKTIPWGTKIEIEKYSGPILMTVGEKDEVWPSAQTHRLEEALKAAGRAAEVHYFPNGGHGFRNEDELNRRNLIIEFLKKI